VWLGVLGYPKRRVDHRFQDGGAIHLGPLILTAHITGGHTRGCTSWSFQVHDGDRVLNVVSACDLGRLATAQYPEQKADLERSFRVLRGLPVDIWVTCHARWWGRYRKFVASATAKDPGRASSCRTTRALCRGIRPERARFRGEPADRAAQQGRTILGRPTAARPGTRAPPRGANDPGARPGNGRKGSRRVVLIRRSLRPLSGRQRGSQAPRNAGSRRR
jgi:hypothetical protein